MYRDEQYSEISNEILDVGHAISRLRGTSENLQDYVPAMRYLPKNDKSQLSKDLRTRRDHYLASLLRIAKERFQQNVDLDCIYATVLQDKEEQLSKEEVSTVCLSLVSGGFETVPGTIISCIGSLSTADGQYMQEEAVKDIMRYYPTMSEAWDQCLIEEKVPYVNAIVKEALRYYTVLPLGQPRKTIRDIEWNGSIIPEGTTILFNTQAANHGIVPSPFSLLIITTLANPYHIDVAHFGPTAHKFDPSRWLDSESIVPREVESTGIQHFGFGGGSRMCPGYTLAQRMVYIMLVRMLTSYRIEASQENPPNTHFSEYNTTKTALVAVPAPFKVKLHPRSENELNDILEAVKARIDTES